MPRLQEFPAQNHSRYAWTKQVLHRGASASICRVASMPFADGHGDIRWRYHDIRLQLLGESHCATPIIHFCNHLKAIALKQSAQSFSEQPVIIGNENGLRHRNFHPFKQGSSRSL